ncbi:unnamed protein product [Hydatigera taeniaeformis]|uniref:Cyclin N-terminal domain-containing protein n=1 Tax=Hydatigena taeniaeformis TaxID=6205 RepID=A0A0R3XA17_HYDTA|nr:unnamed protein product [Hydatigera taeniaeformis]
MGWRRYFVEGLIRFLLEMTFCLPSNLHNANLKGMSELLREFADFPDRVQVLLDNSLASFLYNALDSSRSRRRLPPLPQSQPKLSRSNSRQGGLAIRPKAISQSPSVNANLTAAGISSGLASTGVGVDQGKRKRRISELQILAVCLVYAVYEATVDTLTETLSILPPYCISSVIAVGRCSFTSTLGSS